MWDVIGGNALSLGAMICDSISGTRKTKKSILLFQTGSQFFYLAGSIVLNAYSAATQNVVAIFRNIYGASEKQSRFLDWLFVIAPLVLGIAFNNLGFLGLIPVLANLEYGLVVLIFKGKPRSIKIAFVICCTAFIYFNFMVKNYVGALSCVIVVVTTTISLLTERKTEVITIDGKCYYEAYDDRYELIHEKNLTWFSDKETQVLDKILNKYVDKNAKLLEIGCGEGRDSKHVLDLGYNLVATDVSKAAIRYCKKTFPEYEQDFDVLDAVKGKIEEKYDFIYAISVIHLLTEDDDRKDFLKCIKEGLAPKGMALICSMGDGEMEIHTDPKESFKKVLRNHLGSKVEVAQTSCRVEKMDFVAKEMLNAGFIIVDSGISQNEPDYDNLMWFLVMNKK